MDRTEASRCIAKIAAYLACGKTAEAQDWTARLVAMLRQAGLRVGG